MKTACISFVETEEQWQRLAKHRHRMSSPVRIVPVTPHVDYLAACSGEPYQTVEDFYSEIDLIAQGNRNITIVEQFADDYDRILRSVAAGRMSHEWVSARGFYHQLKGFFDSLSVRFLPVHAAFKRMRPECVVCFAQPVYRITGPNLLDKPSLSLTSRIALLVAQTRGCRIEWATGSGRHQRTLAARDAIARVREAVETHDLFLILQGIRRYVRGPRPRRSVGRWRRRVERPVLVHSIFEDLGTTIVDLWNQEGIGDTIGYEELFPEIAVQQSRMAVFGLGRQLWECVRRDPSVRRYFVFEGVDLFSIAEPLLRRISMVDMPDLLAFAPVIEQSLSHLKPAVILTGGMVGRNSVIGQAADAAGIPVVSDHYGGFMGYSLMPMHERYDLAYADYFICKGSGGASTFDTPSRLASWRPQTKRATPVPIGSIWVEQVVQRERQRAYTHPVEHHKRKASPRRALMYITSALVGDNRYLGYVFHPEIWYWRFQRELVQTVAHFPEVRLLLKLPLKGRYPQIRNPLVDWLRHEQTGNVDIIDDTPLDTVLDRADAFIVDSPSTPLLYLSATDKPFIVYAERAFFKFVPEAAALLRKRALFVESREECFETLERFLKRSDWTLPQPVNDEFLSAYGTHLNDGRAAERCVGFLRRIALSECPSREPGPIVRS